MLTKTKDKNVDSMEESLPKELEAITRLIYSRLGNQKKGSLALVRILEGVTKQEWEKIRLLHSLDTWIGIPLEGQVEVAVDSLSKDIESLLFQRDHDPLTGVGNRRLFDHVLEHEIERERRTSSDLSIISLDIDYFKKINDTYGHSMGDEVLKHLGKTLSETARTYDTAARVGGEEFSLLLPAVSSMTATIIARRMLKKFSEKTFTSNGKAFTVTFSAGVSSVKTLPPPVTSQHFLESVDKLLYKAKNSGRNTICSSAVEEQGIKQSSLVQTAEKQLLFG